jgi:hypothetical protein
MAEHHPSTPQPRAPRNLWPSPSFSDYFSGDEYSPIPAKASSNGATHINPSQQRLLFRLNEIGNQILRSQLDGQTPGLLDSELDALEQTLNAPESQSRAPAELEDSGLFIDDEAEDERRDALERQRLADQATYAELEEGRELIARVSKATDQLKQRYEEVKVSTLGCVRHVLPTNTKANSPQRINALATTRMQTASAEIDQLMSENEDLHMDIADIHSAMVLLKMQLKALEVQAAPHLDSEVGRSMREDIERWKVEWRDANLRLQQRRHVYRRGSSSATSSSILDDFGNGMSSSSMQASVSNTRPGLMWGFDSDPFITPEPLPDIETQEAEADEEFEPRPNDEPATESADKLATELVEEPETTSKDEATSDAYFELVVDSHTSLVVEMSGEREAKPNGNLERDEVQDEENHKADVSNKAELHDESAEEDEEVEEEEAAEEVEEEEEEEEDEEEEDEEEEDEEEEVEESELESPPPEKTAWQELWDSITEFAGVMDYDDE